MQRQIFYLCAKSVGRNANLARRRLVDENVGAEQPAAVAARPQCRAGLCAAAAMDLRPMRSARKKADAPFTIPMPGTSSRKRDVRLYTRGFEDESRPREADRDIAASALGARP